MLISGAGEPASEVIKRQFATLGAPLVLQEDLARILSALQNGQTLGNLSCFRNAMATGTVTRASGSRG